MPWNDNKGSGGGGGPWGGGGNNNNGGGESPWGKPGGNKPSGGSGGGSGGNKDRPDLEETLRRMQERFKRKDGGGNSGGGPGGGFGRGGGRGLGATGLIIILAIGIVGWLFTGIYQVNEQERAVVLRFGTFHRYEEPGFKIRLPNPIERHIVVPVNTEIRTELGGANVANLMLTGDENIIDIDFVINWRVFEPRDYLFKVVDVEGSDPNNHVLIEQIGESAMREVVGTSAFEPITTTGRTTVETRVRDLMQQTLNSYQAGVEIISISLRGASAPEEVVSVQREVSSAEQDKAKREAEAIAYRNKVVPEAEGQAQRVIQEAEGYKAASVANARGEADRFNLVYEQYRSAPRVTRERMFLETMERVLGRTDQVILDNKAGAVPILPLDQLRGRQQPQGQ